MDFFNSTVTMSKDHVFSQTVFQKCIGTGAFGIVFHSSHKRTGHFSAIKLVLMDSEDAKHNEYLIRETKVSDKMPRHVNVVTTIGESVVKMSPKQLKETIRRELLETEEQQIMLDTLTGKAVRLGHVAVLGIQMELCGDTLRDWLNSADRNEPNLGYLQYRIITDMVKGLKHLHSYKIIHRDLKPENLMFTHSWSKFRFPLKLGDFGLCRTLPSDHSKSEELTRGVGTYHYMAPEVRTNVYGLQSDIFSVGLITWEVLALMDPKDRTLRFFELVDEENEALIEDMTEFTNAASLIISATKRKPESRMQSIDQFNIVYEGRREAKCDDDDLLSADLDAVVIRMHDDAKQNRHRSKWCAPFSQIFTRSNNSHKDGHSLLQITKTLKETVQTNQALKCVIVGDGAVGKSCLVFTYEFNKFPTQYIPTVLENSAKEFNVDGSTLHLGLWGTAGQSDFDKLRPLSYPLTDVFLICFSIANPKSLLSVEESWIKEVRHYCPKAKVILVGLQNDRRCYKDSPDTSHVINCPTPEKGKNVAVNIGAAAYLECSAIKNTGVREVFQEVLYQALSNVRNN